MSIILSIDLGTSSMKTTLFTADGKIISQSDAGYTTMYPAENRAEQRPNDWWSTLLTCLAKLPEKERKRVVTLGLSGHMMAGFGITTSKGAEGAWAVGLTGLPESAVVVAGAGDGICAGVGAASVEPGAAYNYIGTTSWIANTSSAPVADPHMRVVTFAHAVPGLYHPLGVMQTAGAAVEWFCRKFLSHVDGDPSEEFDRLASASAAGSRGLMFLPYLLGERSPWWNTECRAAWLGLSQEHGLADMARALLEGVNHNLAIIAEIVREYAPFQELSLLGGGGLSAHWPQMLCNSYAVPLCL